MYILASHRVGGLTPGFEGLAVSMCFAAVLTLPFSLGTARRLMDHPGTIARVLIVAVMAIVLGFAADLQGLRRLKPSIAGVLLASDPAIAFLVGWLLLSQSVRGWDLVGLACVVIAGAAVTYGSTVGEGGLSS